VIDAFAVGLPARNESDRIVASIDALARAARRSSAPVHLVVVADRCEDATELVARDALRGWRGASFATVSVRPTDIGTAGGARHAACLAALQAATATLLAPERIWIATSDADSTVPRQWFALHAAWSARGALGVAGLVELATDDELSADAVHQWRLLVERAGIGPGHPHVHGANLGIRADLWLAAGGFDHRAIGEDHELWRRARALGASLVATADIVVRTSARTTGRTPGGLAGLLARFEASAAGG